MIIYFIRHGETLWNVQRMFQGAKNSPLTEKGRSQTKKLKEALNLDEITHFYSSPLGRARETLELILEDKPHTNYNLIDEFREINMGEVEGLPIDNFKEMYPNEYHSLWESPKDYNPAAFKGENFDEVMTRIEKGMNSLISSHKEDDVILIVSHGITLQGIFAYITNNTYATISERKVPENTSFTKVLYTKSEFKVLDFSNTTHLD